jgi:hypothetical protein
MNLMFRSSGRALVWLGLLMVVKVAEMGWEPPPWRGQVRVFRSQHCWVRVPHEEGMRVKDAIARSRSVLGEGTDDERVVVYHWRCWLPQRVPDAMVMGIQNVLGGLGLHQRSSALWWWWDGVIRREDAWREAARDGSARDRVLQSGEMIIVAAGHH